MRHLVRDVSRVLTLFLASRQAWPKILGGGEVSMFGGKLPPKGAWIKHCVQQFPLYSRFVKNTHLFSLLSTKPAESFSAISITRIYYEIKVTDVGLRYS